MIDKKEFLIIRKELSEFDEKRELIIKKSRDILKNSKAAIYSVHRNELKEAYLLIQSAKKDISGIKAQISKDRFLETIGAFNSALEEYCEAVCYYGFIKSGRIPGKKAVGVDGEVYLLGICDLTGELTRKAVASSIKGDYSFVMKIKNVVEDIYSEFLKFNLRNSALRKKSDSIKWNLQKIEDVVYDLRIRGMIK